MTAKATFPNENARLWPGELVFLEVQLAVRRHVLVVPTPAVLPGQDSSYVYVVGAHDVAAARPVAPSGEVNGMTIVDRGLTDGDVVVVDGQSRLNPGAHVVVLRESGDTASTRTVNAHATPAGSAAPQ